MNSKCMTIVCTLGTFIVLTGCGKSVKQEENSLAIEPLAEMIAIPSDYATKALDKTGGLEAWGRVRQIQLNCVVTFYDKDGGYYLTEQNCEIYPWSDSIVISGKESQDKYIWQLTRGKFEVLEGKEQIANFKNQIDSGSFASVILDLMTAPVRLLDKSFLYTRDSTEINIQGQLCYPITMSSRENSEMPQSVYNIIYYQNKLSSLIDIILLSSRSDNKSFLVFGYDYEEIINAGISIPNSIEIHLAGRDGTSQRLLLKIDVSEAK